MVWSLTAACDPQQAAIWPCGVLRYHTTAVSLVLLPVRRCTDPTPTLLSLRAGTKQNQMIHLPELALGTHGILGPHLHAIDCRTGIVLSGQVAAHHLVLVVLEVALQHSIKRLSQPPGRAGAIYQRWLKTPDAAVVATVLPTSCGILNCFAKIPQHEKRACATAGLAFAVLLWLLKCDRLL